MVVQSTQPLNFVPKIWNKIVAKISARCIPSDAEIFASNSVAKKKNRTRANFATVQFLVLKFLTDLWIKHLGPNGWYKNFL